MSHGNLGRLLVRGRPPLLFVIFGASGSGKTTLLRELEKLLPSVTIHTKGTDRRPKRYDGNEIKCVERVDDSEYDYIYTQYGHRYGIQRKQILESFAKGAHHFVICNSIATIEDLRRDFPGRVRVLYLWLKAPRQTILDIQRSSGISDDEINLRLEKIRELGRQFVERADLFDESIVNEYGASPERMLRQVVSYIQTEERNAVDGGRASRSAPHLGDAVKLVTHWVREMAPRVQVAVQPDYMFILMPIDQTMDDTLRVIIDVAKQRGLRAQRIDDLAHDERLDERILTCIRCANYVVADLTRSRPNVYYELGYAHALGKKVILIARQGTRLHFDVRNYPVIFYPSCIELRRRLRAHLREQSRLSQPSSGVSKSIGDAT